MCYIKRFSKKNCPSLEQRREVANEYVSKSITKSKILKIINLNPSSFYYKKTINSDPKKGRPIRGYSINPNGTMTPDSWIVNILQNYRYNDLNFANGIGCKALHEYLKLDYQILVNHKKIYRICKENNLLLSRKKKIKKIKNLAANIEVTGPNKLWQFDIKYGFIHGENKGFYLLAFIDVFTKKVVSYHLGLNCKKEDLILTLKAALNNVADTIADKLIIRSDNGPQMTSKAFKSYVEEIEIEHEFTPIRCPNKNAYIESFFSIFEIEFLQVRYFENLKDAHNQIGEWIEWYNHRRLHSKLKYNSPEMFLKKFNNNEIQNINFSA